MYVCILISGVFHNACEKALSVIQPVVPDSHHQSSLIRHKAEIIHVPPDTAGS